MITTFIFDKLPQAPQEIVQARISFPWEGMTPERFSPVTASARSFPPFTFADSAATDAIPRSIWLPITSAIIGPPPL